MEIDSKGGLRAWLNDTIRILYRSRANEQKFRTDISVNNSVAIAGGVGTVPNTLMREFLHQANISNDNNDLITYLDYGIDANQTFDQLAYLWIVGDEFRYIGIAPDLDTWSGDIVINCPSFPEFPMNMTQAISFPSEAVIDDLCTLLAQSIMGRVQLQV